MNALKTMSFRTKFELNVKPKKWFPKHMNRGYREMEKILRKVDCVVEVHDSRIPFSGRNSGFIRHLSAVKPHLLVMNKMDLMDFTYKQTIKHRLESEDNNSRCIFVDSLNPNTKVNGFSEILPTVLHLIRSSDRFNREDFNEYNLMVIGVPNVGKSTIINKLRSNNLRVAGKATITGAIAGVTKAVLERIKINSNPKVYLYDTPGVLEPKIDRGLETTMRCALCATLSDEVIGVHNIADYLLFWLNRHQNYTYVEFLGLDKPSDDIKEVLIKGSVFLNFLKQLKSPETGEVLTRPDLDVTAQAFVSAFRKGMLGHFVLDDDII